MGSNSSKQSTQHTAVGSLNSFKTFYTFKGLKCSKSAKKYDTVRMFVSGNAEAASNVRLQKLSQTAQRRLNAQISRSSKRKFIKTRILVYDLTGMIEKNWFLKMVSLMFWVILISRCWFITFQSCFLRITFSWFLSKNLTFWVLLKDSGSSWFCLNSANKTQYI